MKKILKSLAVTATASLGLGLGAVVLPAAVPDAAPEAAAVSIDWFGNNHGSVHSVVVARKKNGVGTDHIIRPGGHFWGAHSVRLPLACSGVYQKSDDGYRVHNIYGGSWYNFDSLQFMVRVKECNK